MRRHLPRLLLLMGALLSPVTLYALGLGEIRLHSALNQPFDAEIELISPTADELAGLKVGLASPDLYSRYGIDRPIYLTSFDVLRPAQPRRPRRHQSHLEPLGHRAVRHDPGRSELGARPPAARVHRSARPAGLHAVAARSSGAGHDAADRHADAGASSARSHRSSRQSRRRRATPLPTPSEPTQEPVATASSASGEPIAGEYTVERNDTLYRIASRVTQGGSRREINRTMIALFRANPAAFNGNINRLRSGSVLRIPELVGHRSDLDGRGDRGGRAPDRRVERRAAARAGRTGRSEPAAAGYARRNTRCTVVGDACT